MLFTCFFLAFATSAALAQAVGERIVVTAGDAKLQTQNTVVGTVPRGTILTVKDVNGEWFWVNSSRENETVRGWIHRREVISFEKSVDFFNRSLRQKPSAEIYTLRGMIFAEQQDYDKALADFEAALRLDPHNADALSARDRTRREQKELDHPAPKSGKLATLDPQHAVSYYKRGLARQSRGDFDRALEDFNQALRFDPQHAKAFVARGMLWQSKGELDKAITDYDEALRLDPQQAGVHANRGIAWHQLRRFEKAAADWNEAIQIDPKHMYAHYALAWQLATCPDVRYRDGKRAVELATKACELSDWKYANGINALAAAYAESGDFENAVKWQEEFLRLSSESERKKWGFLLDLYKSRKTFRGVRQESGLGHVIRQSPESAA